MQRATSALSHLSGFLRLIFPSFCPVCGSPSDNFRISPICTYCWKNIRKHEGRGCRVCAAVTGYDPGNRCQECRSLEPRFDRVIAYGIYEGALREMIHLIKFGKLKRLAAVLGSELLKMEIPEADCIVPVPLSIQGLRGREFNQAAVMAKEVAEKRSIPLFLNTLVKVRETLPQSMLPHQSRKENIKGAYNSTGDVRGRRVLLVDDVVTTGMTVNECARELKRAGALSVTVLAAARASYR